MKAKKILIIMFALFAIGGAASYYFFMIAPFTAAQLPDTVLAHLTAGGRVSKEQLKEMKEIGLDQHQSVARLLVARGVSIETLHEAVTGGHPNGGSPHVVSVIVRALGAHGPAAEPQLRDLFVRGRDFRDGHETEGLEVLALLQLKEIGAKSADTCRAVAQRFCDKEFSPVATQLLLDAGSEGVAALECVWSSEKPWAKKTVFRHFFAHRELPSPIKDRLAKLVLEGGEDASLIIEAMMNQELFQNNVNLALASRIIQAAMTTEDDTFQLEMLDQLGLRGRLVDASIATALLGLYVDNSVTKEHREEVQDILEDLAGSSGKAWPAVLEKMRTEPETVDALVGMLSEDYDFLIEKLLIGLGSAALPWLPQLLNIQSTAICSRIVPAIGSSAVDGLVEGLESNTRRVRYNARSCLRQGTISDARALSVLKAQLKDPAFAGEVSHIRSTITSLSELP